MGRILDLHTFLYLVAYHLCGLGNTIATRTTPIRIPVSMVDNYASVIEEKSTEWKGGKIFISRKQADIEELIENSNGEIWLDTDNDAFVCIPQYLIDVPSLSSEERIQVEKYLAYTTKSETKDKESRSYPNNTVSLQQFLYDLALQRFELKIPADLVGSIVIPFKMVNTIADQVEKDSKEWPDGAVTICRSKDDVAALVNESLGKIHYRDGERELECDCKYLMAHDHNELTGITYQLYLRSITRVPKDKVGKVTLSPIMKLHEFLDDKVKEMIHTGTVTPNIPAAMVPQYNYINALFLRLKDIWVNCIVTHNESRMLELDCIGYSTAVRELFIDVCRIIDGRQLSQVVLHYHKQFGRGESIISDAMHEIYDLNGKVRKGCEYIAKIIDEHVDGNDVDMVINFLLIQYIKHRLTTVLDDVINAISQPLVYGHARMMGIANPGLGQVKPLWDQVTGSIASYDFGSLIDDNKPKMFF